MDLCWATQLCSIAYGELKQHPLVVLGCRGIVYFLRGSVIGCSHTNLTYCLIDLKYLPSPVKFSLADLW